MSRVVAECADEVRLGMRRAGKCYSDGLRKSAEWKGELSKTNTNDPEKEEGRK